MSQGKTPPTTMPMPTPTYVPIITGTTCTTSPWLDTSGRIPPKTPTSIQLAGIEHRIQTMQEQLRKSTYETVTE